MTEITNNYVHYTPIGDGVFTTELLDQNFQALSQFSQQIGERFVQLNEKSNAMNADILALAKIVKSMQKPTGSIAPYIIGAGIGIYIYRNRQKVKAMMDYASQQAEQQRKEETLKTKAERADQPSV